MRTDLLTIFNTAIDAVGGKVVVKQELESGDYPDSFHVVAIGKAADAMLSGVLSTDKSTENTKSNAEKRIKTALLISKHNHISQEMRNDKRIQTIESDHPLPKQATMKAGLELINYLTRLPEGEACIFLISGGTSALVEVLHDDWDLPQLQELTDYLLANGFNINQINAIRRRLSKIKGGGLWEFVGNRKTYCLMISDVPDDNPADIGSGLLFPVIDMELPKLPERFSNRIPKYHLYQQSENFVWKIIASLDMAKKAASKKAINLGYTVKVQTDFLEEEAEKTAINCVEIIRNNQNTLFIWGGETKVYLPENSGLGGRNQHLALSAAIAMTDLPNAILLAAGTDGSDGMSDATGAMVDNKTLERGDEKDLNAQEYLQASDSNSYLKLTEDIIVTGATGTNVMDLVLAINRN